MSSARRRGSGDVHTPSKDLRHRSWLLLLTPHRYSHRGHRGGARGAQTHSALKLRKGAVVRQVDSLHTRRRLWTRIDIGMVATRQFAVHLFQLRRCASARDAEDGEGIIIIVVPRIRRAHKFDS